MNKFLPIINENKKSFLGIPVYRKIYYENFVKTYICGIKIKKINIPQKSNTAINKKSNDEKSKISKNILVRPLNKNNQYTNNLCIGIKIKGGLGDILIGINYLFYVKKLINSNATIDIYAHRNLTLVKSLLPKNNFFNKIFLDNDISDAGNDNYDLFIVLNRYPDIRRKNMSKIFYFAPELVDFIHNCEKFRLEHINFFNYLPVCDGMSNYLSEILNKKRIQQPDIYNMFNISEKFSYELDITEAAKRNFNLWNLSNCKYITIHRGCDDKQSLNSIKLWPLSYYNSLVKYIKENFPTLQIIQLGINDDRCPAFDNIDLNLVGKTSIEDIKIILKNSLLHIDGEGGFIHLRHALNGGPSVVLFGPTSPLFYGYSENINLRSNGCKYPCEWVINDWQSRCCRGYFKHPCMYALTPEFVFKNIKLFLENYDA